MAKHNPTLQGQNLDEQYTLNLAELSHACEVQAERIVAMVEEGILAPTGRDPLRWRFDGTCLRRARKAFRLQRDLEINLSGIALALDLLEEIDRLQRLLRHYQR